jgi:hypothetical protein
LRAPRSEWWRMLGATKRNWRIPILISCLLLLFPLAFSSDSTRPLHLDLPRVFSGDEPHYLVLINSVLLDGDLDLANNYAAVHRGEPQAGARFSGFPLDHHTYLFEGGSRKKWDKIYETNWSFWDHDSEGHPVPRLRAGQSAVAGHPEFSQHPPGSALLLAPLLFAFRGTQFLEPLAIACSTVAIIIAMFFFRSLIRKYNPNSTFIDLVTFVSFLGTPAWLYGRTLFTEPYLLLFAIGSYSLALRGKNPALAGTLIAVGMLMKPTFALFIIPLWSMYCVERKFASATLIMLPGLVSLSIGFWLNFIMFSSPWRFSQEWVEGSFLEGAVFTLFSVRSGLLVTAPAIIVAIATWPRFLRIHPRDAVVLLSGIGLHFVLFAFYGGTGGAGYSARYMVPILPLLFVSLASLPDATFWRVQYIRQAIIGLCAVSVVISGIAAIHYWKYWDSSPVYAAVQFTTGWSCDSGAFKNLCAAW